MSTAIAIENDVIWWQICAKADLVAYSGVAAWLETRDGPAQVALFYLPAGPKMPGLPADPSTSQPINDQNTPESDAQADEIYAVDNRDPFSDANVIARGIVGDVKGKPVVASPIYKQHFRLRDGICLEETEVRLRHWPVRFDGDRVMVAIEAAVVSGRI